MKYHKETNSIGMHRVMDETGKVLAVCKRVEDAVLITDGNKYSCDFKE